MQLFSFLPRGRRNRLPKKARRIIPIETLEERLLYSVGGGFIGSGIHGDYYQGINLDNGGTVAAAFSRSDVRIDFDWSYYMSPGGSGSPGQSSLGVDNFSVRWTGQIAAKYSETYTFKTTSDDGVRLYIKAAGSNTWTTVINNWTDHSTWNNSGTFKMVADQKYDIKLEYYEHAGNGQIKLKWSSASTAEEVIEPVTQIGVNGSSAIDYEPGIMFADMMKLARLESFHADSAGATLDSNGWLTGDADFILVHGLNYDMRGLYTMSFNGQADVSFGWAGVTVNSKSYDAASNLTTIKFTYRDVDNVDLRSSALLLKFTNTRRLATDTTPTGITNIKIMRPIAPGATTSYAPNEIFTKQYKDLISKFTVIRNMDYLASNTNANSVLNWADRMKPGYSSQQGALGGYEGSGGAIEYAVALSNETGKDLWLNIPIQATDDYLTKLAYALKYGTDANGNPYTSPQTNPVYAPVEPNLKIYLELSNEVWNSMFKQGQLAKTIAQAEVANNTATGKAINYDNVNNADVWAKRWWALRTAQVSTIFRQVWGDGAMMQTVRPVFQFQYGNLNNTAVDALQFLDHYLNNTNGNHVSDPHPVNYFLYAAGGAWYASASDPTGVGIYTFTNPSFEYAQIGPATYQQAPAGSDWIFSGTAGLISNGASATIGGIAVAPPMAPSGGQAAYIAGTGSISQRVTLPAGVMDISFRNLQAATGTETISVYIDGKLVSTLTPGRSSYNFSRSGTANVTAGEHTITITGSGNGVAFLDDLKIETVEAIFKNSAISSVTNTVQTEVNWARAYGLKTVGYEGGFSVGYDSPSPVAMAANVDPRVQQYTLKTIQDYYAAGGDLPIVFNASFGGYSVVANSIYGYASIENQNTPKLAGYADAMNAMPPTITNATLVPNVLDATNVRLWLGNFAGKTWADQGGNIYQQGGWVSWDVNVPAGGKYVLTTNTTGTGGKFVVLVDEQQVAIGQSGQDAAGTITLSAGLHTVKVRSTDVAQFRVNKITFSQDQAPAAPTLSTATFSADHMDLAWTPVPGATDYRIMYGTAPGNYTAEVDMGAKVSGTISGLTSGVYYAVVYAYDTNGLRSLLSNQIRVAASAGGVEYKIDFQDQTAGTGKKVWTFGDYTLSGLGNGGTLQIQDSGAAQWPGGWQSTLLVAQNWGNGQGIERADHTAFDMSSIDLAYLGTGGSAVITGYDASGASFKKIVNLTDMVGDRAYESVALNWNQVVKVEVRWYEKADGGGGARFGAIDNVVINKDGSGVPQPTIQTHTVNAKTSYSYVDASGDTVTIKLTGPGTASVYRLDGAKEDASRIVLSGTTSASSLNVSVTGAKSSPKTTTVGEINLGTGQLKTISAAAVDLNGVGVIGINNSYVTSIALRDLLNGADIILPGTASRTSVVLSARHVGDGSEIRTAMAVSSATFADFGNGSISAASLGKLRTTGIKGALAGDFSGTLTVGSSSASTATALTSASIAGAVLGGVWQITGNAGAITAQSIAGTWQGLFSGRITSLAVRNDMSGTLKAQSISTWTVGGNASNIIATIGSSSTAGKEVLTSMTVGSKLQNSVVTTLGGIGTIAAAQMLNNAITAGAVASTLQSASSGYSGSETIRSIKINGDSKTRANSVSGNHIAARNIKSLIAYYPDTSLTSQIVSGVISTFSVAQVVSGKTQVTKFSNLTTLSPAVHIPGFDVTLM